MRHLDNAPSGPETVSSMAKCRAWALRPPATRPGESPVAGDSDR